VHTFYDSLVIGISHIELVSKCHRSHVKVMGALVIEIDFD